MSMFRVFLSGVHIKIKKIGGSLAQATWGMLVKTTLSVNFLLIFQDLYGACLKNFIS